PPPYEAGGRPERRARVHVLAAGVGVARGELGEDQRAEEADRPTRGPGDEGQPGAAELLGDEPRRAEDPRPHHDADDHGEAVPKAERPFELWHRLKRSRGNPGCARCDSAVPTPTTTAAAPSATSRHRTHEPAPTPAAAPAPAPACAGPRGKTRQRLSHRPTRTAARSTRPQ